MNSYTERFTYRTKPGLSIMDISRDVQSAVSKSGISEGLCNVSVIGSTAGISTVEFEDGLISDIEEYFEKVAPSDKPYHHDAKWHDGNGHSHIRSTMAKTSQTFQVEKGSVLLGTWQQIILMDFDNKPRNREISVKVLGE